MFDSLKSYLLDRAIRLCLKRNAPNRYALDGSENFRSCFLGGEHPKPPMFRILGIEKDNYTGLFITTEKGTTLKGKIRKSAALDLKFYARVDLPHARMYFDNTHEYLWKQTLLIPQLTNAYYKIKNFIIVRKIKFHHDRFELLKRIIESEIDEKSNEPKPSFPKERSKWEWFVRLYGFSAFGHPIATKKYEEFSINFQSFIESGEIKSSGNGYLLAGKAMTTLSAFQMDERRHSDLLKQNRWIIILTVVIATSGIANIFMSPPSDKVAQHQGVSEDN
ncbi:hypothetical protein [Salipiger abyssi]|uniref:hypothetical protein n=1 Tax=Salipiger abyssi TaxID=1250539 RepID=UPI0040585BB6